MPKIDIITEVSIKVDLVVICKDCYKQLDYEIELFENSAKMEVSVKPCNCIGGDKCQ